ncbi:MAG: helix-turn-helix domain-containing protein, partial [Verrucomicrobiales bacterium]
AEAQGDPVSLADLCRATGVGKSTLYEAFHLVCGLAPMAYFHKRKLTAVRSALVESRPARGAVKQVALRVGFTELGRFAREYRKLFGELPSVKLNRNDS